MPTRPETIFNKGVTPFEKQKMNEGNTRRSAEATRARDAQLNARVDAANAAKKAVADVKSFASKPKAGGAPAGRFGGQQGAMQNMAAKKAANDKSDVQMSKRMQPPKNMKAATPNITPRQSPNPSAMASSPRPPQKPMTSSPRPPQKPMASSPRPPQNQMTSSPRPPQKPMTSSPRPPKRPGFKAGGSVKKC